MYHNAQPITILMAEDDADDRMLVKEAFAESHIANNILFVEDGVELLEYLRHQGKYKDTDLYPDPHLILLDLNMPRKDGREAIKEIKANPETRKTPVVILTTSTAEEDILRSYDIGAAGYITKPVTFEALVKVVRGIEEYWIQIVRLPFKDSKESRK